MSSILALTVAFITDPDFEPVEPTISEEVRELAGQRGAMSDAEWIAQLEALGEAGDYSLWELIAELLSQGDGDITRDPVRACDYFERIGTNRGDALHSAAGCYFNGSGREQDLVRARGLYEQAIEAGYITSLCGLGTMLVNGQGGPVDAERGVALCRQAAELGDINAMTDLGGFLLTGNGVERDPVEAREWLELAAGQGQANAAHLAGQIYTAGDGVDENHVAAAQWFQIAHDAGRPDSSWLLSLSLARQGIETKGDEVTIDRDIVVEAREWALDAAQRHPNPDTRAEAEQFAENLAGLLTLAEQQ